jgi:hypothetical protein
MPRRATFIIGATPMKDCLENSTASRVAKTDTGFMMFFSEMNGTAPSCS